MNQIKIGIVGTSFGAEFISLFRAHPNVRAVCIADLMPERLQYAQDMHGALETFSSLDEMLKGDVDAVCIFTARWSHAKLAMQALRAGKHVYSAVPMAITLEEISALIETVKTTGQMYMLGETSYYFPVALFCREKFGRGEFGHFVFGEAEYLHDMSHGFNEVFMWAHGDDWKQYASFPPMLYATHSVAMIVSTVQERLTRVSALGYRDRENDGIFVREVSKWGNDFSNETALFRTSGGGIARINEFRRVGWSETARANAVRTSLYGTLGSFEEQSNSKVWNRVDSMEFQDVTDLLVCAEPQWNDDSSVQIPGSELHEELARAERIGFARIHPIEQLPKEFAGMVTGHEGSHQFLVDDFVRACVTMQPPPNNVWQAARYNAPGIVAHESAMRDGESLAVPDFGDAP